MRDTTKEIRPRGGGPGTSNTRASNARSPGRTPDLGNRSPARQRNASEGKKKARGGAHEPEPPCTILSVRADTVVLNTAEQLKPEIARDFARLRWFAAGAQGKDAPCADPSTGVVLESMDLEQLVRMGDEVPGLPGLSVDAVTTRVSGRVFAVADYPFEGYEFFLQNPLFNLFLFPKKRKQKRPGAKVWIRPEGIASLGIVGVLDEVGRILDELVVVQRSVPTKQGKTKASRTIARIDIKCDFLPGEYVPSARDGDRFSTRAGSRDGDESLRRTRTEPKRAEVQGGEWLEERFRTHWRRHRDTGWTFGRYDNVQLGAYDKTIELVTQHRGVIPEWFRDELERGFGGPLPVSALDAKSESKRHVWRLEARFSGRALRSVYARRDVGDVRLQLDSPASAIGALSTMWNYALERFCRLTDCDDENKRKDREKTNATWEALRVWTQGLEGTKRSHLKCERPTNCPRFDTPVLVDIKRLHRSVAEVDKVVAQHVGTTITMAAAVGVEPLIEMARDFRSTPWEATSYLGSQIGATYLKNKVVAELGVYVSARAKSRGAQLSADGKAPTVQDVRMLVACRGAIGQTHQTQDFMLQVERKRIDLRTRKLQQLRVEFGDADMSVPRVLGEFRLRLAQFELRDREWERAMFEAMRLQRGWPEGVDVRARLLREPEARKADEERRELERELFESGLRKLLGLSREAPLETYLPTELDFAAVRRNWDRLGVPATTSAIAT